MAGVNFSGELLRQMPNFFRRVWRAPRIATLWNRALDRSAEARYEDALSSLQFIYELLDVEMPSPKAPFEFNMTLAHVHEKLREFAPAIAAAGIAVEQLKSGYDKGLSTPDRKYLLYYCKILLEFCMFEISCEDHEPTSVGVAFD